MAIETHSTTTSLQTNKTQTLLIGMAGSGKTEHIVQETVQRIEADRDHTPLVVTSTKRTCALLQHRLDAALKDGYEPPPILTPYELGMELQDRAAQVVTLVDRVTLLTTKITSKQRGALRKLGMVPTHAATRLAQRIDRLKRAGISAENFAEMALANSAEDDAQNEKDRSFAELFLWHDEELQRRGWIDRGQLILDVARELRSPDQAIKNFTAAHPWLLVDEFEDFSVAERNLTIAFARLAAASTFALDDDQSIRGSEADGETLLTELNRALPEIAVTQLGGSQRLGNQAALAACTVSEKLSERLLKQASGNHADFVEFWQSSSERAQALAVAAAIDSSLTNGELNRPEDAVVIVRASEREGVSVSDALRERGIPYTTLGEYNPFRRREVRDLLAWIRLLTDPTDSGAVMRALARPPMSLNSIDIARTVQIGRRRKIDMIAACAAALQSPQIAPESRERIGTFLRLHKSALSAIDTVTPQRFIDRLIEHLGLRGDFAFSARADSAIRLTSLSRLSQLAEEFSRKQPLSSARDFGNYLLTAAESDGMFGPSSWQIELLPNRVDIGVRILPIHTVKGIEAEHVYVVGLDSARLPGPRGQNQEALPNTSGETKAQARTQHEDAMRRLFYLGITRARRKLALSYVATSESGAEQKPAIFLSECLQALEGNWKVQDERTLLPDENLNETFTLLRDQLVSELAKVGRGLSELRFDTDLDLSSSVVRYLELVKLAALKVRPSDQALTESIENVNQQLLLAMTNEQRDLFLNSDLDQHLLRGTLGNLKTQAQTKSDDLSLAAFLPTSGDGLVLSASDLELYRSCPLRYKFARVFRLPQEQTPNQRFGIVVHNALEHFHAADSDRSITTLLELLETGWRRAGFTDNDEDNRYKSMAEEALAKYLRRLEVEQPTVSFTERSFSFPLGKHTMRGRVDRVDRLPDGTYELIDYKTGRARRQADLKDDIQLSLYSIAAREAWGLDASLLTYYYVIDDVKVPVPTDEIEDGWIEQTVERIGENIKAQEFEPTPSFASCNICAYKLACPAAEV